MLKKIFISILFFIQILNGQDKVRVILDSLYSYNVGAYMHFNVILPKDYFKTEARYTVIYLLHGYSGNHFDWINRTSLIKYLDKYNYVVITPEAHNSWYTNSIFTKRNYEDYVIKELIPFVEKKYRVIATRHGRVIAGLSMGGYGAIKFALKYPNYFYYAGSFSGAFRWPSMIEKNKNLLSESLKQAFGEKKSEHWAKNDVLVLVDSLDTNVKLPYLYISCGTFDPLEGLLDSNKKFIEKIQKKKILFEYHEIPGEHNWIFWDKEINNFLEKLSQYNPLNP